MSSDEYMEPECDEEEGDDMEDSFDIDIGADADEDHRKFDEIVGIYNTFLFSSNAVSPYPKKIEFSLPSDFLPLAQQVVYGFSSSNVILNFHLELVDFRWDVKPLITFEHPIYQQRFIGRPLVVNLIEKFFSDSYVPSKRYRAATFLLSASGHVDAKLVQELVGEGFDKHRARTALVLCRGNKEKARDFLKTGEMPDMRTDMPLSFEQCPLLYFVIEVAELFLGLGDHCCFCGDRLKEATVKPSVCDKQLCNVSFTSFGVGTSLLQEIRRDPDVADLMISCFATALETQWLMPAPPGYTVPKMKEIISKLPRVSDMAAADDDKVLAKRIGDEATPLLNWILLSNKSQLISLPPELRLKQFPTRHQFLTLISNTDKEEKFKALKVKYGSKFLWHGSSGDRWHSIIRNGLKNGTGTAMQQNGSICGTGIYFAAQLETSRVYARPTPNLYKRSTLGTTLQTVGLCEVANVPELIDHKRSYTCVREEAVIVRFIFFSANFDYDVVKNPPVHVPKLKEVLNYQASLSK